MAKNDMDENPKNKVTKYTTKNEKSVSKNDNLRKKTKELQTAKSSVSDNGYNDKSDNIDKHHIINIDSAIANNLYILNKQEFIHWYNTSYKKPKNIVTKTSDTTTKNYFHCLDLDNNNNTFNKVDLDNNDNTFDKVAVTDNDICHYSLKKNTVLQFSI
jgi:SOS-response transcriptional repressor LexA